MNAAGGAETRDPNPDELAAVLQWERNTISGFLNEMSQMEPLFLAVEAILAAPNPRAVVTAARSHPGLLSDSGQAAMELTRAFAEHANLALLLPLVQDRQAWLNQMRKASIDPDRFQLPDE